MNSLPQYLTTRLVCVSFGFNAQVLTTSGKILYLPQPFPCDQYGCITGWVLRVSPEKSLSPKNLSPEKSPSPEKVWVPEKSESRKKYLSPKNYERNFWKRKVSEQFKTEGFRTIQNWRFPNNKDQTEDNDQMLPSTDIEPEYLKKIVSWRSVEGSWLAKKQDSLPEKSWLAFRKLGWLWLAGLLCW